MQKQGVLRQRCSTRNYSKQIRKRGENEQKQERNSSKQAEQRSASLRSTAVQSTVSARDRKIRTTSYRETEIPVRSAVSCIRKH